MLLEHDGIVSLASDHSAREEPPTMMVDKILSKPLSAPANRNEEIDGQKNIPVADDRNYEMTIFSKIPSIGKAAADCRVQKLAVCT